LIQTPISHPDPKKEVQDTSLPDLSSIQLPAFYCARVLDTLASSINYQKVHVNLKYLLKCRCGHESMPFEMSEPSYFVLDSLSILC